MAKVTTYILGLLLLALVFPLASSAQTPTLTHKQELREKLEAKIEKINTNAVIISGKITSIEGLDLKIEKSDKTYTIHTSPETSMRRRFWGKTELLDMSVGDTVNIIGRFTDTSRTVIEAKLIRDTSIQVHNAIFAGTLKGISGNTLVFESLKHTTQTATVSSETKFTNRKNQPVTLTDLKIGHTIRIKGLWNRDKSTLINVTNIKDYSL